MSKRNTCTFDGCEREQHARELCKAHHKQLRRGGPLKKLVQVGQPADTRFWGKVDKTATCWYWVGATVRGGYGVFVADGQRWGAHRFAWASVNGDIPSGMLIDHICHHPACVRPDHLRLATRKQNTEYRRGIQKNNRGTRVRGVQYNGYSYQVYVGHDGRSNYFGSYSTLEEAQQVAIRERARLFDFPEFGI